MEATPLQKISFLVMAWAKSVEAFVKGSPMAQEFEKGKAARLYNGGAVINCTNIIQSEKQKFIYKTKIMDKNKFSIKNTPGWAVMLAIFGILYATGLHTEAIAQVQRLLLATGIKNADMPAPVAATPTATEAPATTGTSDRVGAGFQMTGLDGKTVSFESLKGKVVFMNIWATWCPPCIAEMPNIQSLYEKVGSDKIAFVMLSVDEGGMDKVKKFINKKGFTFPVYMPAGQFPQEFYSNAIPTTFIISPEGKIVARQEGMAEYDTKEVREFLQGMVRK